MCVPTLADRAMTHARQRRVGEEAARRAREGAGLAREALALQTESVAMMIENAVANPRFMAAVRGRVSRDTFADLPPGGWRAPYRALRAAVRPRRRDARVRADRERGRGGRRPPWLWAAGGPPARRCPGPAGHSWSRPAQHRSAAIAQAVLVLAKRIDNPLLEVVAQGAGRAVLLSDGKRSLGHVAARASACCRRWPGWSRRARLAGAVGRGRGGGGGRAGVVALVAGPAPRGRARRRPGIERGIGLVGRDRARGSRSARCQSARDRGRGRPPCRRRGQCPPSPTPTRQRRDGDRRFDDRAGRRSSPGRVRARPLPAGR